MTALVRRTIAAEGATGERAIALVRLAFLPAAAVGHELRGPATEGVDPFVPWFVAATLYAAAAMALSTAPRVRGRLPAVVAVDLVFLAALTYHSGGASSHLRYAFLAVPLGAAFLMRPRITALCTLAAGVAYVVPASLHPDAFSDEGSARVVTHMVYLAWLGGASVLFSGALARRSQRIGELAAARGHLVAELIGAEEHERRRVATMLHDGPVQQLLLARSRLGRAAATGAEDVRAAGEAVSEAIGQLRGTMQDLHPYVLDFAGLGPALETAGDRAMPDGMRCDVEVAREATGFHDQILYAVARELLVNAAKHADGERVTVQVERAGDVLELRVRDDGCGFADARRRESLLEGHIGLASCAQRVEALGGRFDVRSAPGAGTDVRVIMPIGRDALAQEAAAADAARARRPAKQRSFVAGGRGTLQARGAD